MDPGTIAAPDAATPKGGASNADAVLFAMAEQAGRLFRKSNADALSCGRLLLQAREIAEHGAWLAFLRDVGMTARTAQKYMRVARYVGDCSAKCALGAHLGINRTLDILRASDRVMAAWRKACVDDPANDRLVQKPPGCALTGIVWCVEPEDRAILAEVAAHDFEIDIADVLAAVEVAELPTAVEGSAP